MTEISTNWSFRKICVRQKIKMYGNSDFNVWLLSQENLADLDLDWPKRVGEHNRPVCTPEWSLAKDEDPEAAAATKTRKHMTVLKA